MMLGSRVSCVPCGALARRVLQVSRCITNESDASWSGPHMYPPDPGAICNAKIKVLKGEAEACIPGAEGWSQTLASVSEAVVKAERSPELSVPQLQQHTVRVITEVYVDGTSRKVGLDISHRPSIEENLRSCTVPPTAAGTDKHKGPAQ